MNASADVPGTFEYSPAAGTVLEVGSNSLAVTFTPSDTGNYTTAAAAVSLTVTPIGAVPESWTDLQTLGGTLSKAFAINAAGTVVGYALNAAGEERPVVWSGGSIAELPRGFLSPAEHRAVAINGAGQIAGRSGPPQCGGDAHAVTWQNNTVSDLGRCGPPPYFSRANGINDAGVVVRVRGRQLWRA